VDPVLQGQPGQRQLRDDTGRELDPQFAQLPVADGLAARAAQRVEQQRLLLIHPRADVGRGSQSLARYAV
jgi:hypothetical protein